MPAEANSHARAMSSQSSTMHPISTKSKVECLKGTSTSSSSALPIPEAPTPTHVVDNCQSGSDCDDSASTAASDVGERWADFADSDEGDDAHDDQPGGGGSSSAAAAAARAPAPARAAAKTKWADLADDSEEDVWAGSRAMGEDRDAEKGWKVAPARLKAPKTPALAAQRASKYSEAKLEPKQKWGKRTTWAEVAEPSAGSTSEARSSGRWSSSKASSSQQRRDAERWSEERWRQGGGAAWWSSQDAEWWGSKAASQKDWRSRQQASGGSWGASWSQQADRRGAAVGPAKPQCQFFIGIEEDSKFKVTRKVLGPHGQHMKSIAETSGAKLRLRGQGSGFLEGPEQQESTDELMLCVSAPDQAGYEEAVKMVRELMERVYDEYRAFCRKTGKAVPDLQIRMHEGPRPGSR